MLPVQDKVRFTIEHWQTLDANPKTPLRTQMPSLAADTLDRFTDSHREPSPPRWPLHEADTVSIEAQLEGIRITRKGDPRSQFTPPPSKMVAAGRQWVQGQPLHHLKYALQMFTDASKGWDAHLGEHTARGT